MEDQSAWMTKITEANEKLRLAAYKYAEGNRIEICTKSGFPILV